MPNYKRTRIDGACFFFTVVTHKRQPLFNHDLSRSILRETIKKVQERFPFEIPAFCLMPDHLHCIWQMPEGDSDYSKRWSIIKRTFSQQYLASSGINIHRNTSRINKRELGIWQRRFWEHRCRDRDDYYNHINYIHYNPIKHKLVNSLKDWPYSTYHKFFDNGYYTGFNWDEFLKNEMDTQIEFNE